MGLGYLDTLDDFQYKGINIPIIVHHEKESGSNPLYKVEFEYKDCRIQDWYYHEDPNDAYSLARLYCRVIDEYGSEGVKIFKKCKKKLSEMKRKYIVVDNKIFRFDAFVMDIHPYKIHRMKIEMTDGSRLDGDSMMNHDIYIKNKDEYSRKKTLENLRWKVQSYFTHNKVLPCEEFFLEKETKEYNELLLKYKKMIG